MARDDHAPRFSKESVLFLDSSIDEPCRKPMDTCPRPKGGGADTVCPDPGESIARPGARSRKS